MIAQVRAFVQLRAEADPIAGRSRLAAVEGVRSVTQTFPDETDAELVRMFVIDLDGPTADAVLQHLAAVDIVEYAELAPERGIR